MKRLFFALMLVAWTSPLLAQGRTVQLVATGENNQEPISLSEMNVEVRILGEVAETRTTMTFSNPHSRILEGNLTFPLPEKAVISGYGLNVNGVMVDGVVVEKKEAQRIFEAEKRRNVDPGLVEWVKGNNFQTRVYPIPAHGSRTAMVRYLSELTRQSGQTVYHLPLDTPGKLKNFHLRVEVVQATALPVASSTGKTVLDFKTWNESYVAETTLENVSLKEDLAITLPQVEKKPVWVEKNPDGFYYFCINDYDASSFIPENKNAPAPSRITIYWDGSGSREKVDHQRELNLLAALLAQWKTREVQVELIVFRNAADQPRLFTVANGDSSKLLEALSSAAYDGGTQLGAISPAPNKTPPDFYLLFTDGLSNFGSEEPSGFKAPLYAFSTGASSNYPMLAYLANKFHGEYFNLSSFDDKTILASLRHPVYQFMGAKYDARLIEEALPKIPEPVHGKLLLAGRLIGARAEVILQFGSGGHVLKEAKYVVDRKNAAESNLFETVWAMKKIQELMAFPERNHNELVAMGKEYGLVTPGTSLLVLESLDQYVRYHVMPPASLPEIRAEYQSRVASEGKSYIDEQQQRLNRILDLWRQRVAWWNRVFPEVPVALKEKWVAESEQHRIEGPSSSNSSRQSVAACRVRDYPASPERSTEHRTGLQGYVTDQTGAVIPGAEVCLRNSQTNDMRGVATTAEGYFIFENPPQGKFDLVAQMPGFKPFMRHNLEYVPNQHDFVSITLEVGAVMETVEVTAATPLLQTESSSLSAVTKRRQVQEMPLNGRNTTNLIALAPGAVPQRASQRTSSASPKADDASYLPVSNIEIKPWDPQTPYLKKLKQATPDEQYTVYLEQRKQYASSPAFFLDCAEFFLKQGQQSTGLQVLSNLAELELESAPLLRILAHRLAQLGENDLAATTFETVLKMRPEEPQSYRDLALVLAEQEKYERAMELLNQVVIKRWDRFDEIEVIALMELNRIIPLAHAKGIDNIPVDPQLIKLLDVDLRIVLTWDADATDVDIWVTEPSGEKAYYAHTLTRAGGHCSKDFTQGYGPEEYVIHKASEGKYLIQANYYGSQAQVLQGPVTVQAEVYTNYGRPNEKRQTLTLRLNGVKDTYTIGEIEYAK